MVHNRLDAFEECLESMFSNTNFQFTEILICNDGSNRGTTKSVLDYVYKHSGIKDINLMHFSRNQGQGCILEFILNYATYKNPNYLFLLEQDYIWRDKWAEEAVAVLEACPSTIMVPSQSHRHYHEKETPYVSWSNKSDSIVKAEKPNAAYIAFGETYVKPNTGGRSAQMIDYFGQDLFPRHLIHKPFDLDIKNHKEYQIRKTIKVQPVSNTTTSNIINWRRLHDLRIKSNRLYGGEERFWEQVIRKACGVGMDTRVIVDDEILSQGICHFWYKTYKDRINKEKDFPILDICDYSIGNHIDEGGHHSTASFSFGYAIDRDGTEFFAKPATSPKWTKDAPVSEANPRETFVLRAPFNVVSGYGRLVEVIAEEIIKDKDKEIYFSQMTEGLEDSFNKYKDYIIKKIPPLNFNCKELMISPMQVTDVGLECWSHLPEKKRTLFTMWECSALNSKCVTALNKMENIIVPNDWNVETLKCSGVNVPVHKVPLFVDTEIFKFKEKQQSEIFKIGIGNDDPRKNLESTLKIFLKAFPINKYKNVRLEIKSSKDIRLTDDRIKYLNKRLTDNEMAEWYQSLDCFVSLASAEGWGMMQCESMACGTPVIAPVYGGLKEFMNEENSYPLKYTEVLADVTPWSVTAGGLWSKYDENDLIEKMKYCYNNQEELIAKGVIAAESVKNFTIQNMINKIKKVMQI